VAGPRRHLRVRRPAVEPGRGRRVPQVGRPARQRDAATSAVRAAARACPHSRPYRLSDSGPPRTPRNSRPSGAVPCSSGCWRSTAVSSGGDGTIRTSSAPRCLSCRGSAAPAGAPAPLGPRTPASGPCAAGGPGTGPRPGWRSNGWPWGEDDARVRSFGPSPSDAELVRAARAGCAMSLGVVVERHRASMHAVALQILGYRPDSEDAVQDAVLVALRRLGDLNDPGAVGHGCARSCGTGA
jgi:hypothetical protein